MHIRIFTSSQVEHQLYIDNDTVSWKYVLGYGIQLVHKWNIK